MATRQRTDLLVFHCSATRPSQDITAAIIREWHMAKGWNDIGYHFVIKRDGTLEHGRPLDQIGAHVEGHNSNSVGICMVGGLDAKGDGILQAEPGDAGESYTTPQWITAHALVTMLRRTWPNAKVLGHRDLSPDLNHDGKIVPREWLKTCPGFDATKQFAL